MFRLRRARNQPASPVGDDVRAVAIPEDVEVADPAEARRALRRIAAEGVILQDEAEALLEGIRRREPLAELSPRGGPLVSRFVELRKALPPTSDAELRRHVEALRMVFDHHAMLLSSALELLAHDWRGARIEEQLDRIDGLGAPALWLEDVRAELEGRPTASAARS